MGIKIKIKLGIDEGLEFLLAFKLKRLNGRFGVKGRMKKFIHFCIRIKKNLQIFLDFLLKENRFIIYLNNF